MGALAGQPDRKGRSRLHAVSPPGAGAARGGSRAGTGAHRHAVPAHRAGAGGIRRDHGIQRQFGVRRAVPQRQHLLCQASYRLPAACLRADDALCHQGAPVVLADVRRHRICRIGGTAASGSCHRLQLRLRRDALDSDRTAVAPAVRNRQNGSHLSHCAGHDQA